MLFQQMCSDVEENFDHYAQNGLCVYSAFLMATPIGMPTKTRDAVIKAWNDVYLRDYGQKAEMLWLSDLDFSVVQEKTPLSFLDEKAPPYDILMDKLLVQHIDVTQYGWQQAFNEAYQTMRVNQYNARRQLQGLVGGMVNEIMPIPLTRIPMVSMEKFNEAIEKKNLEMVQAQKARRAICPVLAVQTGYEACNLACSAVDYLNLVGKRLLELQKMQANYAWYRHNQECLNA